MDNITKLVDEVSLKDTNEHSDYINKTLERYKKKINGIL